MTVFSVAAVKKVCEVLAFNIGNRSSSSVIWHITVVQSKARRITTSKQKLYTYLIRSFNIGSQW